MKEELFWKKGLDECWPWTASTVKEGYGRFGQRLAHRVSHELNNRALILPTLL